MVARRRPLRDPMQLDVLGLRDSQKKESREELNMEHRGQRSEPLGCIRRLCRSLDRRRSWRRVVPSIRCGCGWKHHDVARGKPNGKERR